MKETVYTGPELGNFEEKQNRTDLKANAPLKRKTLASCWTKHQHNS